MLIARSALAEVARNFFAALTATTGAAFFMLCIVFLKKTPGVGLGFLVEVFPLFFPLALQFTVPISVLAAVIMTFGRIAGDGELTALHACGVPLGTLARPVLAFAAVVALLAFILTDLASPFAAARLNTARRDLIYQLQTSFRAGLCDLDLGRGRISFESFDGRDFEDICVEWRTSRTEAELWRAQRGSISVTGDERVVIRLRNAQEVLPRETERGEVSVAVGDMVFERTLDEIVGEGGMRRRRSGLSASELAYVGSLGLARGKGVRIHSAEANEELARRAALAGSAFFFALIGIPLAVLVSRMGRAGAMLLGIGPILLVYFPLVLAGSAMARSGNLPAFPAVWAGNAVLAVMSVVLYRKAVRR
jgi:lipopolysaccharide export system permease protein